MTQLHDDSMDSGDNGFVNNTKQMVTTSTSVTLHTHAHTVRPFVLTGLQYACMSDKECVSVYYCTQLSFSKTAS